MRSPLCCNCRDYLISYIIDTVIFSANRQKIRFHFTFFRGNRHNIRLYIGKVLLRTDKHLRPKHRHTPAHESGESKE